MFGIIERICIRITKANVTPSNHVINIHRGQAITIFERIAADACHAVGESDGGEA